nr:hypothetical protein [Tanacetum cinerariifolium]
MGEPLSPDRMFDFPMDELEPHPAYDFFTPGPLPGFVGNPNNMNGWIEADVPLLGEMGEPLGAETDEPMVELVVDEVAEQIVKGEDTGFPVPPSVIEGLGTRMGNLEYGHGHLVKKVIQVSDAEVADGIAIREIGLRVPAVEGHVQLQALVSKMSSRKSTLMQCILGMDRRLADLERRPPRPQQINVWVKLSEGENVFTPAIDSSASNPTPIDCMERVSCNGYQKKTKSKQNRTKPRAKEKAWKSQKSTKVNKKLTPTKSKPPSHQVKRNTTSWTEVAKTSNS